MNNVTKRTHALTGAVAATLFGVGLLLSGCVSQQLPEPTAPGIPKGATVNPEIPIDLTNVPTDRKDVTVNSCRLADGEWVANGKIDNPSDEERTYNIVIYFTTPQGTVLDYAENTVLVPEEGTQEWIASRKVDAKDLKCVLAAVSASPASP